MTGKVASCWRCHERVGGPVCPSCGTIQPPPVDPDHFAVLGLDRCWTLTPKDVDRAWRARSRLVHPDRFAGKSAVQRRMSLQWTAAINSARRALRDPVARGWYLATGRARPRDEGGPPLDLDFLETVFELQVQLDDDPDGVAAQARALRDQAMTDLDARLHAWEAGDRQAPPDGPA
ncbi:MAG: Fe-S protein assembly co-chaperone HscB [Oligoflexia bacterium]|nr:Fe-S protein assembly co-chaperone HscB [Oligoflexia bacterium]